MKDLSQHAQSLRSIADTLDQHWKSIPWSVQVELVPKSATLRWIADELEKPESVAETSLKSVKNLNESTTQEAREIARCVVRHEAE